MRKIFPIVLVAISLTGIALPTTAQTDVINNYVPSAKKVGEYRLSYLLWDIYDASLYAPNGVFSDDQPFALRLDYLRRLKGVRIAERSAEEIKEQGFENEKKLTLWLDAMRNIFPNVEKGDTITGIRDQNDHAVFYLNDVRIGLIKDKEFAENFFDIWLSIKTNEPKMRKNLLGQ